MEYEVRRLDPQYKLAHYDEPALYETDDLATAISYANSFFDDFKDPVAVYQPRLNIYRDQIGLQTDWQYSIYSL